MPRSSSASWRDERRAILGSSPVVAYALVRPHVAGDAVAQAIDAAIPAAWPVTNVAWLRRLDPIGVASMVALATGLLLSLPSNGDPLRISLLVKLQ